MEHHENTQWIQNHSNDQPNTLPIRNIEEFDKITHHHELNLAILVVAHCKNLEAPSLWLHKHCTDMSKQIFSMLAKSDELFCCL